LEIFVSLRLKLLVDKTKKICFQLQITISFLSILGFAYCLGLFVII